MPHSPCLAGRQITESIRDVFCSKTNPDVWDVSMGLIVHPAKIFDLYRRISQRMLFNSELSKWWTVYKVPLHTEFLFLGTHYCVQLGTTTVLESTTLYQLIYTIKDTVTLCLWLTKTFITMVLQTDSREVSVTVINTGIIKKSEAQVREVKSFVEDPTADTHVSWCPYVLLSFQSFTI